MLFLRKPRLGVGQRPLSFVCHGFTGGSSAGAEGFCHATGSFIAAHDAAPDQEPDRAVRGDRGRQPAGRGRVSFPGFPCSIIAERRRRAAAPRYPPRRWITITGIEVRNAGTFSRLSVPRLSSSATPLSANSAMPKFAFCPASWLARSDRYFASGCCALLTTTRFSRATTREMRPDASSTR